MIGSEKTVRYITSKVSGIEYKIKTVSHGFTYAVPRVYRKTEFLFFKFWNYYDVESMGGRWTKGYLEAEELFYTRNEVGILYWYNRAISDLENYLGAK